MGKLQLSGQLFVYIWQLWNHQKINLSHTQTGEQISPSTAHVWTMWEMEIQQISYVQTAYLVLNKQRTHNLQHSDIFYIVFNHICHILIASTDAVSKLCHFAWFYIKL